MAASVVDICNMALARIGFSETIASLDERSKAAQTCTLFYEAARDYVLRDFPWNFATRAVQLAEVTDATFPGWQVVYRYPTDCLDARQVVTEAGTRLPLSYWVSTDPQRPHLSRWLPPRIPFEVSSDEAGRLILTDLEEAYLVYTARIEDPNLFDSMFVSALAWHLAVELVMPLAVDERRAARAERNYTIVLSQAQAMNMNEAQADAPPESPSITARY